MKINKARTLQVEKWVEVSITFNKKTFNVSVITKDGIVQGDGYDGFYTSYLTYFNETPLEIRKQHFEKVKKYIHRYIK